MTRPNKNVFDLSHDVKLSCNMGDLIPTLALECVPGDKFNLSCESINRLAPLVAPMMHRVDVTHHYFFVPNRLLWDNWEDYITNPDSVHGHPYLAITTANWTELADYLGIPDPASGITGELVSALPFAAYQKIWDEYYRDQNLVTPTWNSTGLYDGDNTAILGIDLMQLHKRAWEHDYFTSALPWAQKGAAVNIPLGFEDTEVVFNANNGVNDPTTITAAPANVAIDSRANTLGVGESDLVALTSNLQADTTINELRRAFRLQEWLEKAARAGSRYKENIMAFFGVDSGDARLQRPEYIYGTKNPIMISEVLNTTGTVDAPQGNMAGHGIGVTQGGSGNYFCREHGYIIGVMSILPKTAYQQGIPKHFLKYNDLFEYYQPQFANIGEQEIMLNELWAFNGGAGEIFGYTPRYAEYRFQMNRVAGDFRNTLDHWHMGRIFDTTPALNSAFIEADPTHRVFAVTDTDEQKIWCQILHKIRAVRAMPKYGTPSF